MQSIRFRPAQLYVSGLPDKYPHDYIGTNGPQPVAVLLRSHPAWRDYAALFRAAPAMLIALRRIAYQTTCPDDSGADALDTIAGLAAAAIGEALIDARPTIAESFEQDTAELTQ